LAQPKALKLPHSTANKEQECSAEQRSSISRSSKPSQRYSIRKQLTAGWMLLNAEMAVAFEQMDNLLQKLKPRSPFRVLRMRRDIAWLVQQADKRGLQW